MTKIRVLFDFEPFGDGADTDLARYTFQLADALASTDEAEVRLVAGWHRSRLLTENPRPWVIGVPNKIAGRFDGIRSRRNQKEVSRVISEFRPDVVHCTSATHGTSHPGSHRRVVTIRDLTCFAYPETIADSGALQQRVRRAVADANHIFCATQQTQTEVIDFLGVPAEWTSVVHDGVPSRRSEPTSRYAKGNFFLFVGRRDARHDFNALLQALASTPTLSYTRVVAFGGGPLTTEERRHISLLNLKDRVVAIDGGDPELEFHYSSAIALIQPALHENDYSSLLRALSLSCPIACSRIATFGEICGETALFFTPADVEDLSTTLVHLAADSGLRERMAKSGQARAQKFTWIEAARKTLAGYRLRIPTF